jgi:choline kinase
MVPLAGRPLIAWQVDVLRACGVNDIALVTGYRAQELAGVSDHTRHNPKFASTNMVYSLMCAEDLLDGEQDVLVCYSDIVYEASVLCALTESNAPISITVDKDWKKLWSVRFDNPLEDAETLTIDGNGNIVSIGQQPDSIAEIEAQYMGLIKFRADVVSRVVNHYHSLDRDRKYDGKDFENQYMTTFLQDLILSGIPISAVPISGGWLEVDSVSDLETYEKMHQEGQLDRLIRLESINSYQI